MNEVIPIRKFIRIALITTPFLGITGATPGLLSPLFSYKRLLIGFCFIMLFATIIWTVNIFLLYQSYKWKAIQKISLRFIISAILACIIAIVVFDIVRSISPLPAMELPALKNLPRPKGKPFFFPVFQSLAIDVIVFILIELIMLRESRNRMALENEQLKTANLEAKIDSLKEQLHPHFLFNSLSTLRSLISRSPEKAELYLEQLAELLRFSTNNSGAVVPLKDEIALCISYLNMQKVRFTDALEFEVNIPEEKMKNIAVPVYSLQQLAENAIKHNSLTRESPLKIEIVYNDNTNEIKVSNNLQSKQNHETSLGTGLANLSERYKLMGYKGVDIRNDGKRFVVAIQLMNNESSYN